MFCPLELFLELLVLPFLVICAVDGLSIYLLELIDLPVHGGIFFLGLVQLLITFFDLKLCLFQLRV